MQLTLIIWVCVIVEGQKSRVENSKFLSITTILKASKRGKTISFALKTEKFRLWL
jgi:hypothetical protein